MVLYGNRKRRNCAAASFGVSLRAWLDAAPHPRGSVKLHVDVDPYRFL